MTNLKETDSEKTTKQNGIICDVNKNVAAKPEDNMQEKVILEDALQLTGVGRYSYILFVMSIYSLMSAASEIFGVGIIATAAQCDLDLSLYRKGLIGSLPMLGVMTSGHLWGYVADTRGRKFTLIITMGGTFLLATISSFANHWVFLAVAKFFSAMFASGTNAVMYALLGESTPQSHRARFLLYTATGVMFSQGLMSIIAYPILRLDFEYPTVLGFSYRPWRLLAQTYGLMSGFNLILLLFFVYESPKFYLSRGRNKEGIDVLTKMFVFNTGKNPESYPVKHVILEEEVASKEKQNFFKSIWNQTAPLLRKPYIKNSLLICYTSICVYSVGPAFVIWFPSIFNSYIANLHRVNEETFCEIVQIVNRTATAVNLTSDAMCDDRVNDLTLAIMTGSGSYLLVLTAILVVVVNFIGKRWTFIIVHLFCAVASLAVNFVTSIASVFIFILMISNACCMGITTTYAVEIFPTYLRAMAVCLSMMVGRSFSFIVINLIGPLLATNCSALFYGFNVFILSGAVAGWFLPPDKKKPQKQDIEKLDT